MEKLRVNRFNDRVAEIIYFIIEPRLNLVYGIVSETETELKYYDVCIAPFWSDFQNTTVYEMAVNPTGERYETGEPATIKKELLTEGIFANKLDITKSRDEVYYLLTGKRKKAIYTNIIG